MVAQIILSFFVQKRKASTKKSGSQKKKNPSKLLLQGILLNIQITVLIIVHLPSLHLIVLYKTDATA